MSAGAATVPADSTPILADLLASTSTGITTSSAGATSNTTGWLWRKMSKLSRSAKRRWRGRFRGLSSTMRDFHLAQESNGETFIDIFQNFSYYVLWLLEGVVVVVGFCVFFLRFGGRL